MSSTIDMSCNILDDEELERVGSLKSQRMELRQWIPDIGPRENPFEKGFIKPTYTFPKAFQNKTPSEEFPPLIYRGMSRTVPIPSTMTTTNLLLRVKEKLEKEDDTKTPILSIVSTVTTRVISKQAESQFPPYAICTPSYSPHTPPYPPE